MKLKKLSTVFRRKLLKVSAIFLICSFIVIFINVVMLVRISTSETLRSQIAELVDETEYYSDLTFDSPNTYLTDFPPGLSDEELNDYLHMFLATNWYYIDSDGIVKFTNDGKMKGMNAASDSGLGSLSDILSGKSTDYKGAREIPSDDFKSKNWKKYVVNPFGDGGYIVLKYEPDDYYHSVDTFVERMCNFESVGAGGNNLILHRDGTIISPDADSRKKWKFTSSAIDAEKLISKAGEKSIFRLNLNGTNYYAMYAQADGYIVLSVIPRSEVIGGLTVLMTVTGSLVLVLLTLVFIRINSLTKRLIVNNISEINSGLSEITSGNLDAEINVRDNLEFDQLSNGINSTVGTLKGYIVRESERLEQELQLARSIQASALPSVFPPFPDRRDIDIYATMKPAKQVGGDFYDFFFVDDVNLVFLTADVSDKGIPAAMFMMKAKTIIKSLAQSNLNVESIISSANNILCEDNSADMFVTLWIGILNTATGELSYVNSGHCKPLLRRSNGGFEYLSEKPDFVVAIEENIPYHRRRLTLKKDDALILYTDGVTEAMNSDGLLYGEQRLKKTLNSNDFTTAEELCAVVGSDVSAYSVNARQTDDITILALVYHGSKVIDEMTVDANFAQIESISEFISDRLKACGFSGDSVAELGIVTDEICNNITNYAYPDGEGKLTARFVFDPASDEAALTFIDKGVPFNPLNAPEPDIENAENNKEGGLGIFLVRRYSDRLQYEYSDNMNILTVIKRRA